MGIGIAGIIAYSFLEYFTTPGLWAEFLVFRICLSVWGAGLILFVMIFKKGSQAAFYAFWAPMFIFAGYGMSRFSTIPGLLAWNSHICFYVLFLAIIAVSPPRLTWIVSVAGLASFFGFMAFRPSIAFPMVMANGGFLYIASFVGFPVIILVRYRLVVQNLVMQRQIALQNEELRRANASKDRFFSILAHDLKGPIGSSMRVLERLRNGGGENAAEELTAVSEAVNRSYALLENLLWWARSQRGELSVLPVELSVEQLVSRTWREISPAAQHKQIVLETAIDGDHCIVADKKLAYTIMLNLLSNAMRYTAPGGRVTVSSQKRDARLVIEVRDTGTGMDEEKLGKLFKIDEKQSEASDDGERGSGLGLIVSREFAEKNGGSLSATSVPGQGSSFFLEMPSA
jgi:signal transduction histidine kinase